MIKSENIAIIGSVISIIVGVISVLIPCFWKGLKRIWGIFFSKITEDTLSLIVKDRQKEYESFKKFHTIMSIMGFNVVLVISHKVVSMVIILCSKVEGIKIYYDNIIFLIGIISIILIILYNIIKENGWLSIGLSSTIIFALFWSESFNLEKNLKLINMLVEVDKTSFLNGSINQINNIVLVIWTIVYIVSIIGGIYTSCCFINTHKKIISNIYVTIYFNGGMLNNYPLKKYKDKKDIIVVSGGKVYSILSNSIHRCEYNYSESILECKLTHVEQFQRDFFSQ